MNYPDSPEANVFLEKHSRFFRQFELSLHPRKSTGAALGVVDKPNMPSLMAALVTFRNKGQAKATQPNGDTVELVDILLASDRSVLTLLFVRSSPTAADPVYKKQNTNSLRQTVKEDDEDQAVSAHLLISTSISAAGAYSVVLEEIPGLSASVVVPIIKECLSKYNYGYKDSKGVKKETYSVLKVNGKQSETLQNILSTGRLKDIRLSRRAKVDFMDADGLLTPGTETMSLKVKASLDEPSLAGLIKKLRANAMNNGWTEFSIDLGLSNERNRTIKFDRLQEASEIFFIKSEMINFDNEVPPCTVSIINYVVDAAKSLLT